MTDGIMDTPLSRIDNARLHYLPTIPTPDTVLYGHVVVHNHVRPARRQGARGFRFWLGHPGAGIEPCPCHWAPELGVHYQVAR